MPVRSLLSLVSGVALALILWLLSAEAFSDSAYPSGVLDETGTIRPVQRKLVNASGSGASLAIAAQGAGIRIRVLALVCQTTAATTVKFQSATTDISGSFALPGGVPPITMPFAAAGWFETNPNEALNVNMSTASVSIGCQVIWIQAP